ncbi:hypothetical protein TSOC_000357 [Tetrabaena socialis]|uniref:Uncharacterized protein n=1 Tax=Tetrabaena socialis TaxID=47790 RepID=A0A2J8AJG5_9CHLO|nr:hypothetical protein TSOC_000357 [Tetrabaena socialis]|eukprot:PNH12665.1 hypothetical protein TSOC_000357 [Tetrabaena socialis]
MEYAGNVFANPPFGASGNRSTQSLFFERVVQEYEAGRVRQAVVLLKAGVGYRWFRSVLRWPVCFLWERLAFVRPVERKQGAELRWGAHAHNPHGSVAVYLGPQVARWGVWYGFFLVIVILIMAVLGKTDAWTSTLQAFCAALLSVSMIDASEWHGVSGNAGAGNNDAVDAALAGFIIMSIGVALLIIFLGMGGAGVSVNLTVSRGSNKTSPAQEPAKEKAQEKEQAKAGKSPV